MNGSAMFFLVMGWGIILIATAVSMLKILKESK